MHQVLRSASMRAAHTICVTRHIFAHTACNMLATCKVLHFARYGVATISSLFKIIGLFCKRALQKRLHSAKETYNFKEPPHRSHRICVARYVAGYVLHVLHVLHVLQAV